ncbi:TIM barrel protein [Chloroflexota bacterium]
MTELLFGTAGVPHSTELKTTISGIRRVTELGLGCMELEFVQGVRMGEESARQVAEVAEKEGIKLSVHAPYYINLNAHEPEKITASQERLLKTARIASLCGARNIVFHAAFYLGDSPEVTYEVVKKHLKEIIHQLKKEDISVLLRPEITGKPSQFGTIEEILNLSTELGMVAPCIDFAHCHARSGSFNSYTQFASILQRIQDSLGRTALDDMHMHIAGIKYGEKGELKHLNLQESDLHYVELMQALCDYRVKGLVICESPNLEEDALLLQNTYSNLMSEV